MPVVLQAFYMEVNEKTYMAKKKKKIILTPEQQMEADYQKAVRRMDGAAAMLQSQDRMHMYKEAAQMFDGLGDYKDSRERKKECKKRLPAAREEYREEVYQKGLQLRDKARSSAEYEEAIEQFKILKREYKDTPQLISECREKKANALKKERAKSVRARVFLLAFLAAAVAFAFYLGTPDAHYRQGRILMGMGDYERANTVFAKSKNYKDTNQRVQECGYQRAAKFAKKGDYEKAVKILYKLEDYKDASYKKAWYEKKMLETAKAGDTVIFGRERWLVADSREGKRLLVKRTPMDVDMAYQQGTGAFSWAASDMRKWLGSEYFGTCFSGKEQEMILRTQVKTGANSVYGTKGSEISDDQVFLLDEAEARQYGGLLRISGKQKEWWLRSPGKEADSAAFVSAQGKVMYAGYTADSKDIAVRPAIWVSVL